MTCNLLNTDTVHRSHCTLPLLLFFVNNTSSFWKSTTLHVYFILICDSKWAFLGHFELHFTGSRNTRALITFILVPSYFKGTLHIVRSPACRTHALSVPSKQIYVLCQLLAAALKNQIPQWSLFMTRGCLRQSHKGVNAGTVLINWLLVQLWSPVFFSPFCHGWSPIFTAHRPI